jgi:hypothetical protein
MTLNEQQLNHIKAWQASGSTQTAYCQKHGLNKKTFSGWFAYHTAMPKPTEPALMAIEIKPAAALQPAAAEPLRLRLPNGQSLELPCTTSPRWLAELLRCLG